MRTFREFVDGKNQRLEENPVVDLLGKLWLGAVGTVTGASAGALTGAAKGLYYGFADEDPFSQLRFSKKADSFKNTMKDLQGLLSKMSPEDAERFKSQMCSAVQQL